MIAGPSGVRLWGDDVCVLVDVHDRLSKQEVIDVGTVHDLAVEYLSVLLLDPKYVGGPLRLRRMIECVDGGALTFHSPTGPVGTVAAAHLATLHPDFTLVEYAFGEDVDWASVSTPGERVVGGETALSSEPRLGIELRRDALPPGSTTWEWSA